MATFRNAVHAPFIWDDIRAIVDNPHTHPIWPLTWSTSALPQSPLDGRPFASLLVALDYAIGGLEPTAYHWTNLFLHIAAAILFFLIVRLVIRSDALACASATLWLVHPLNTEVVDYVTQRTESLAAVSYLLTLYAAARFVKSTSRGGSIWAVVAVGACAAGLAAKETVVTAPIVVLLFDGAFFSGSVRTALRRHRYLYLGLAASWLLLVWLLTHGTRLGSSGVSPWEYLSNQPPMILRYIALTVWPRHLILDYGVAGPVAPLTVAVSSMVMLAAVAAAVWVWWHDPRPGFLLAFFLLTLAPSSSIVPIVTEVGAERRMYLPLMAVTLIVVLLARKAIQHMVLNRRAIQVGATTFVYVATASVLAAASVQRNAEYADPVVLWTSVLARHPHGRAHYSLGIEWERRGADALAESEYRQAIDGAYEQAYYPLGELLFRHGQYRDAVKDLREYVNRRPDDADVPHAFTLIGLSDLRLRDSSGALAAFNRVLAMTGGVDEAFGGRADALLAERRFADAASAYRTYLERAPRNAAAYNNLGLSLAHEHRLEEAIQAFQAAMSIAPRDPDIRRNLATAETLLAERQKHRS
ncbi:MAG TPA: tetratricopeptide repeat protein [Vicinamibacterales bacterium]|nr:tetratricopeptide repeat protein [Vicinamibacterales bacterium]